MRTAKQIQHDITATKKEMRTQGIRRTSFMNGGLSTIEYSYNALMFKLETELIDAKRPMVISYGSVEISRVPAAPEMKSTFWMTAQETETELKSREIALPGMENVATERAAIAAEEQGEELTAFVLTPKRTSTAPPAGWSKTRLCFAGTVPKENCSNANPRNTDVLTVRRIWQL